MIRALASGLVALACSVTMLCARGGGGCIAAGTLVATPRGDVTVESLHVGDPVWGLDGDCRIVAQVLAITAVEADAWVELPADDGVLRLRVTPEHPIQVATGIFTRAGCLAAAHPAGRETRAYDLLVSPGGVFFAAGHAVHNKGCFLAPTPILLADGSSRAISEIKPGDMVVAFDADGKSVLARVRSVLTHEVDSYIVARTERVELHVTEEHPFYVGAGTFKTIAALHAGDTVWAHDAGGSLTAQRLLALERVTAHVTVYNLQTDEPHTYFADGIAVHNKGGGCFAAGTRIATPNGPVLIESLRLGDPVLAPTVGRTMAVARVQGVFLNFEPLLVLRTTRGDLRTTAEHPLADGRGHFFPARTFEVGDRLRWADRSDEDGATITGIDRGVLLRPVFTLHVDAPHTFIADGFVVHNKGGFHGGSRHHGGGNSGGSSNPAMVVIVLVVILVFVAANAQKKRGDSGDKELDHLFSRGEIEGKGAKTRKLVEFIGKVDAAWSVEALESTARGTFLELQRCWMARDYAEMKALMMPDLYQQHCEQLEGMRRTHEINILENLQVEAVDLVHVNYAEKRDARWFTALITARARDTYVDDRTQKFLRGDAAVARFQEFWTFHLREGRWLLREIEQTGESDVLTDENFFAQFTDAGRDQVYGEVAGASGPAGPELPAEVQAKDQRVDRLLNFLVQTDKIWDRTAMLATARRTYLNLQLARQDGRPAMLTGIPLAPELAAHLRTVAEANERAGWKVEYRNFCVRKVEIVHVDNRDDRTLDTFTARISAHAQTIVTHGGAEIRHDPDVRAWVEFCTFLRDDQQWVLRDFLPEDEGQGAVRRENFDEGSSGQMLEWYYSKTRAT